MSKSSGKKQIGGQPGCVEREPAKRPLNVGGILRTDVDPDIEIVRGPDMTVKIRRRTPPINRYSTQFELSGLKNSLKSLAS